MKKYLALILVLMSTLILATACSQASAGPQDLTQGKSPEQIVEQSFDKLYQLENYQMDFSSTIKMDSPEGPLDMSMSGKAICYQKPSLKFKMVMDMSIPGIEENEGQAQLEQYMVQEDSKFIMYQQIMGQWQKMTIDDPEMVEMMQMDPLDNLKLFMDNLVKAEIVGEEKIGNIDTVKIDLIASADIFNQVLEGAGGQNLGIAEELISPDILSKIGDLRYLIWVDKNTLNTVKCSMDLSENMRNFAAALGEIEGFPPELQDMFGNFEMTMEYTLSDYNSAPEIIIPDEALNAPELMIPDGALNAPETLAP